MCVRDYLARIGYRGGTEPTAENLAALKTHFGIVEDGIAIPAAV